MAAYLIAVLVSCILSSASSPVVKVSLRSENILEYFVLAAAMSSRSYSHNTQAVAIVDAKYSSQKKVPLV
jgi:hypothetical protein